jgi:hypothetical protein
MKSATIALTSIGIAAAGLIDSSLRIADDVVGSLGRKDGSLLEVDWVRSGQGQRKHCTVHPRGEGRHDDDTLLTAFTTCGRGGVISLPDAN